MEILERAAKYAYSLKETIYSTYEISQKIITEQIEGDFVECGVAMGAQIAAMQAALVNYRITDRKIYAIDSFEGIPLAGVKDSSQPGFSSITHNQRSPLKKRLVSSGISAHSVHDVQEIFTLLGLPIDNIVFVKGWFQNTLPSLKMGKISLLRLDGDLYESTAVCLKYLYPYVVSGGYIIVDDYALSGCREAVDAYMINKAKDIDFKERLVPVENTWGVMWFRKL